MKFKNIPIGFLAIVDEGVMEELVHEVGQKQCRLTEPAVCKVRRRGLDHYSAELVPLAASLFATQTQPITSPSPQPTRPQPVAASPRRVATVGNLNQSVLVSTTDMHLACDIAAAVRRVYQRDLAGMCLNTLRVIRRH